MREIKIQIREIAPDKQEIMPLRDAALGNSSWLK
jgi:hypothetical protein